MRPPPIKYKYNLTWLIVEYFNNRQLKRTTNRIDPQQSLWLDQSHWAKQSQELRLDQHGSLIQGQAVNPREHGHFAVPVVSKLMPQHNQNFLDDDDHTYEYIQ